MSESNTAFAFLFGLSMLSFTLVAVFVSDPTMWHIILSIIALVFSIEFMYSNEVVMSDEA